MIKTVKQIINNYRDTQVPDVVFKNVSEGLWESLRR